MKQGILLIAYGNSAYGKFAFNMAVSLRHYNPSLNIHLAADEDTIKDIDRSVFSSIDYPIFPYKIDGKIDAGKTKTELLSYSPFDQTIYLDVDGVVIQDVTPLFERIFAKHSVFFQVMGTGGIGDNIAYRWVNDNKAVWDHFKLDEAQLFPTSQTSIVAFDQSKRAKDFFARLKRNYSNPMDEALYSFTWGRQKNQPDELYYSGTAAQLNLIPDINIQPVFFPKEHRNDLSNIQSEFYILSMWGAGKLVSPYAKDWYDRLMHKYLRLIHREHYYKAFRLYALKFTA